MSTARKILRGTRTATLLTTLAATFGGTAKIAYTVYPMQPNNGDYCRNLGNIGVGLLEMLIPNNITAVINKRTHFSILIPVNGTIYDQVDRDTQRDIDKFPAEFQEVCKNFSSLLYLAPAVVLIIGLLLTLIIQIETRHWPKNKDIRHTTFFGERKIKMMG